MPEFDQKSLVEKPYSRNQRRNIKANTKSKQKVEATVKTESRIGQNKVEHNHDFTKNLILLSDFFACKTVKQQIKSKQLRSRLSLL